MKYLVGIQVIEVWNVTVEASSELEAEDKAYELSVEDIRAQGKLKDVGTEHATTIDALAGQPNPNSSPCPGCAEIGHPHDEQCSFIRELRKRVRTFMARAKEN